MRTIIELIRIILIFIVLGSIASYLLARIYESIGGTSDSYNWMGFAGVFILLFVLYRNRLQFSGWYEGRGKNKLSQRATGILVVSAGVLLIMPVVLSL